MVSEANRTGIYIAIPVYFTVLAGAAYWAYRRTQNMQHEGVSDAISAHYLGGRSFGPIITVGTLFASIYSGYTVIGVPTEAFYRGWFSLRWMTSIMGLVLAMIGTGLRLRKASLIRNHNSPADFCTDRFQSQLLRYTIVFLQTFPMVIYLSAQVVAIKSTFNSIFELDPDTLYPVIIIFGLILLFEWAGGLSSVAFSDAIQGFVMTIAFILVPCVIKSSFGGWKALDWQTYAEPTFYQTPSREDQWRYWNFSMLNFGFFTLPHLMQRTYAADSVLALKYGYVAITVSAWFTMSVGVFIGTVGVQILADAGVENPDSPFAAIIEEVMNTGGFGEFVGVLAFTSSLAAMMSTADSIVIAISQLVTTEIVYPLRPASTPAGITWIGRLVSFFSVLFALLIGIFWGQGLSDLATIQFSLTLQAAPTFLIGLFGTSRYECHPWSLAIGAMSGVTLCFGLVYGYIKRVDEPVPVDAGLAGLGVQLYVILMLEVLRRTMFKDKIQDNSRNEENEYKLTFPSRPTWDIPKLARFGDSPLTAKLLWQSMEDVPEIFTNLWFCLFMFFLLTVTCPIGHGSEPPLDASGQLSTDPGVINGIPAWAFQIIILSTIPTIIFLFISYRMPNDYPKDEDKLAMEGIDTDLVEMTREEMGRRTSYDETNILIHRRRSSIKKTMQELGMTRNEKMEPIEKIDEPRRRRMSSLILGRSPLKFDVDYSDDDVLLSE